MRRVAVLIALVILCALALPVVASAKSLVVKDARGRVRGTVAYSDLFSASVYGRSGSAAGYLVSNDSGSGDFYDISTKPIGQGGKTVARVLNGKVYRANATGPFAKFLVGKAIKSGSSWIIKKKVGGLFRKVGKVSRRCRAPYAIGAGWLLLF